MKTFLTLLLLVLGLRVAAQGPVIGLPVTTNGLLLMPGFFATNALYNPPNVRPGGALTGAESLAQLQDLTWYPLEFRQRGQLAILTNGTMYQLAPDLVTWIAGQAGPTAGIATNLAQLAATTPLTNLSLINLLGGSAAGDGNSGTYLFNTNSRSPKRYPQIVPTPTGNWIRNSGPASRQTPYKVYAPTVSLSYVYDAVAGVNKYNHDASIAFFDGLWYALWNANTTPSEGAAGQFNVQSTSVDGITWTTPVKVFLDPLYTSNPVPFTPASDTQWQPNLLVVGSELWCLWSQYRPAGAYPIGYEVWFSKLASSGSKWVNQNTGLTLQTEGRTYYGFPTQNPIQLQSGRVLAPLVWTSPDQLSPPPPPWTPASGFWINYKRSGVIYTDDGVTWKVGGHTTIPGAEHTSWEPVVRQSQDGEIRMYSRNLDYQNAGTAGMVVTAEGSSDGEVFGPLVAVPIETSSSRLGLIRQGGAYPRDVGFANDWKTTKNFLNDRYNGAIFSSRSPYSDLTPGVNFSGTDEIVSYPQAFERDNAIKVIYSQGDSPRNIRLSTVTPSPDVNQWYLYPRSNDKVIPFVEWSTTPIPHFTHLISSTMAAVKNTADFPGTPRLGAGVWAKASALTASVCFLDERTAGFSSGFALFTTERRPILSLINNPGPGGHNYIFDQANMLVPLNEWFYLGVTIDQTAGPSGTATCYIVNAAGTMVSQTLSLNASQPLEGGTLYIGRAVAGSQLLRYVGDIRHAWTIMGVAPTSDNHRFWHGIDQAALGVTDWAGTETSPGTADYDYWAADPSAGSNDSAWLAKWSRTGTGYNGIVTTGTVAGRNALIAAGTGSASVEVPHYTPSQQFTFSTEVYLNPVIPNTDSVLATIGDKDNHILLLNRTNNPTLIEAYQSTTKRYHTVGSYLPNNWLPVMMRFSGEHVSVSIGQSNSVALPLYANSPRVYLGQGYLDLRTISPQNSVSFDTDRTWFQLGDRSMDRTYHFNLEVTNLIISSRPESPVLSFMSNVTNSIVASGANLVFGPDQTFNDKTSGAILNTQNGTLILAGTNSLITAFAYELNTPSYGGTHIRGTRQNPTATLLNDNLIAFFGAGYDGSASTASRASMIATASENWSPGANGAELKFEITPNGSATRYAPFTIQNTGGLEWRGTAPLWNFIASNNTSGIRFVANGTASRGFGFFNTINSEVMRIGGSSADGGTNNVTAVVGNFITEGANKGYITGGRYVLGGVGAPEGVAPATTGSLYMNGAGGAGTTVYVKQSSPTSTTGWKGVTTAALAYLEAINPAGQHLTTTGTALSFPFEMFTDGEGLTLSGNNQINVSKDGFVALTVQSQLENLVNDNATAVWLVTNGVPVVNSAVIFKPGAAGIKGSETINKLLRVGAGTTIQIHAITSDALGADLEAFALGSAPASPSVSVTARLIY